jgi:peptidoglycan/xylan/chitin deacetylase (PgdA/CDA1 family)
LRTLLAVALTLAGCASRPKSTPPATSAPSSQAIEVALTIDDLPRHGPALAGKAPARIAETLLAAFRRHRIPEVYGFVNAGLLAKNPEDRAVLDAWLAAGHPLGNHTYTHADLHDVGVANFIREIDQNQSFLAALQPNHPREPWKDFRYPYLHEGKDLKTRAEIRAHLAARGARIAQTTIVPADWDYNEAYVRCQTQGNAAASADILARFLDEARAKLHWSTTQATAIAGRPIRQILLLHLGVIDADAIETLLTDYETQGARWITLAEANTDPIYTGDLAIPNGGNYIRQLYASRGQSPAPAPHTPTEHLQTLCR